MSEPIYSDSFTRDDYIPVANWSKDHWSMMAYMNSVMTDTGSGFQVGYDPRMTHGRRNYRVMRGDCPNPLRPNPTNIAGPVMDEQYSTRIVEDDGTRSAIKGHDDWSCVQDFANAGMLTQSVDDVEPAVFLTFSELGDTFAAALTKHKRDGGMFGNMVAPV